MIIPVAGGALRSNLFADQQAAYQYGLTSAAGLTSLAVAIADRNNARVDIPVIGDSITQGQGASVYANQWIQQANRAIRAAYPTIATGSSGGYGFVPLLSTTSQLTYTWPWTTVTPGTPGHGDLGPVRYCGLTEGTPAEWQWTAPAGTTSIKIMYFDYTGEFSYNTPGTGTVGVPGTNTQVEKLTGSIAITAGQVLTVSWVSGVVVVDGLLHYAGDEDSGITLHACGHSGWNATSSSPSGWQQPETLLGANWAQCFTQFAPAAVGIWLGGNDVLVSTAAQFQANLMSLIALIRAQTGLSTLPVVLCVNYLGISGTIMDAGGWPAYASAIRSAAAADSYTHVIDVNYRYPSLASGFGANYLYYDAGTGSLGNHPSDLGHALIGEIAAAGIRIA